jgi:hypothetical protein
LRRPSNTILARAKRFTGTVVGVGTAALSAFAIFGAAVGKHRDPLPLGAIVVGCVILSGFGAAGALLARRMYREGIAARAIPELHEAIREHLLALASDRGGRLTVAELAAALAIAPEPAERALEEAAQSGNARILFSPEGVPVYEFPGLLVAKSDAKEPWEL